MFFVFVAFCAWVARFSLRVRALWFLKFAHFGFGLRIRALFFLFLANVKPSPL